MQEPVADGAREANLYLTPENWLVLINASGEDAFFDVAGSDAPRDICFPIAFGLRQILGDGSTFGEVARDGANSLRFWSPQQGLSASHCMASVARHTGEIIRPGACPRRNIERARLQGPLLAINSISEPRN
jgi:hypothetical protein